MDKSKIRILILDDEPFMLKLLHHMLDRLGFTELTICDNGMAALDWVAASDSEHDLILLDLNMPEMDGIEFVRKLTQHGYRGSLVLVSGENERVLQMAEKLIRAHGINVLGHIAKPVSLPELSVLMETYGQTPTLAQREDPSYDAADLAKAITDDELVIHYQPKVAVTTGEVVGMEALVRWQHPVDGLVFPDQFINLAEEHGMIDALAQVVLNAALHQIKQWQLMGLKLCVAINVSMDNLASLNFVDQVAQAVSSIGVAPHDIVLEVTESRLMHNQRVALEVLTRLRLKRFRLSIDDFGTGHSSLTQLRDISFDELKIDKSFVHGAWHDETVRAIYDASLGVGKRLGMVVVAEGVEDQDDWDLLRNTNCDVAQGYFIARPMPAAAVNDWMTSWDERVRNGLLTSRVTTPQQRPQGL